jgi:hypothetical protein
VALRALGLEDLGVGGRVAGGSLGEGSHRCRRTEAGTRRRRRGSQGERGQVKLLLASIRVAAAAVVVARGCRVWLLRAF